MKTSLIVGQLFTWSACLLNLFLAIVNYRRARRLRAQLVEEEENPNLVCPACDQDHWLAGPSGGMAQNIECTNCGTRFNHTPFGLDWIGHRSEDWPQDDEGQRRRPRYSHLPKPPNEAEPEVVRRIKL